MKVQINFRVINPSYSRVYALEYHGGKESESNWKYLKFIALKIENVKETSLVDNEPFALKGFFEGRRESFEFEIRDVLIFRCRLEDGSSLDFGVSKSILNKTHQAKREGYDILRFYFYINDNNMLQVSQNLFIDMRDLPEKLRHRE